MLKAGISVLHFAVMEQESFRLHLLPLDRRQLKFKARKTMLWAGFTFGTQGPLGLQSGENSSSKSDAMRTGSLQGSAEH